MGMKKKYFLDEEFYETLSKRVYDPNAQVIEREHVYKTTGAKYIG